MVDGPTGLMVIINEYPDRMGQDSSLITHQAVFRNKRIATAPGASYLCMMESNYHFSLMADAIQYIKEHYREQPSLEEVAQHVHLSKFHFQRLFQQWVGLSPKQFLQYTTLEHAKESLQAGRATLATAYEVGLSGNGRLHDLFVKLEACTPGEFQKRGAGILIQYAVFDSPFGEILVAETKKGICHLSFLALDAKVEPHLYASFPEAVLQEGLAKYGEMVQAYFKDWKMPKHPIALDLKGTPFQIRVWKALLQIPSGQHLAYKDVAQLIRQPGASRAVGTAIGRNPIGYLIPCHRVIRESGETGGYRWGTTRKEIINAYERAHLSIK